MTPGNDGTVNNPPQRTTIQLGAFKLVGAPAVAVLLGILLALIALLVHERPAPRPLWISGALWIFFVIYWGAAAAKRSPARSSETPASRRVHERLMWAALLLLFIPVPGFVARFLPVSIAVVIVGIAIHVLSLFLAIAARRHLGRHWSAEVTAKVDHALIRSGPYSVVRHPIYACYILFDIAFISIRFSLFNLLTFCISCLALYLRGSYEERFLRTDPAYRDYADRIRYMFFPKVI